MPNLADLWRKGSPLKRALVMILPLLLAACVTDAENVGRPTDITTVSATDNKLPILTYAADVKYCDRVRKNDWRIENTIERALVHVKDSEIWWNEASFEITNITRSSKGITAHIKGQYEDAVLDDDLNIEPIAKNRVIIDGTEYFYCAKLPRTPPNRG